MTDREMEQFISLIKDMIVDTINSNDLLESIQKPLKIISGDVISVSGNDATVLLVGTTENITIPNFSHRALVVNDKVQVVIMNGNYTNAFVGWVRP